MLIKRVLALLQNLFDILKEGKDINIFFNITN